MPRDLPRDYDDRQPRRSDKEPGRGDPSTRRGGSKLNEFFVDGQGINREVLQREICRFLGPEAHSRPSTYNGVKGYNITAVRPFTPRMLDDLMDLSDAYNTENREMARRGHQGVPYEESRVALRQEAIFSRQPPALQESYPQERYPVQDPYSIPSTQAGYPALSSTSGYPPAQGYPAAYPPDPGFGQGANYPTGYSAPASRPVDNYTYGGESPVRRDQYGQQVPYPRGRGDPRLDPGKGYAPEPRERMDRVPDPRSASGYAPSVYSPGNVEPLYEEYVSAAPRQPGRPSDPYGQSRPAPPASYDPRDPRYRPEPFREERRRR